MVTENIFEKVLMQKHENTNEMKQNRICSNPRTKKNNKPDPEILLRNMISHSTFFIF